MNEKRHMGGLTLLELLVAMSLSTVVLGLAIGIYLRSTGQFKARTEESGAFQEVYLVNRAVEHGLKLTGIEKCAGGNISFGSSEDFADRLRKEFPGIKDLKFRCFELDSSGTRLVEWETGIAPGLIEYEGALILKGAAWQLSGSVLK